MRADDLADGMRLLVRGSGARMIGGVIVDPEREMLMVRFKCPDDSPGTRHAVWLPPLETFADAEAFMMNAMKVIDDVVRKVARENMQRPWSPYPIGVAP